MTFQPLNPITGRSASLVGRSKSGRSSTSTLSANHLSLANPSASTKKVGLTEWPLSGGSSEAQPAVAAASYAVCHLQLPPVKGSR
jgi:hypothetical protein